MARRIDIRPLAYVDLAEIAEYIARDNPTAARRFLFAAEASFAWLAENPDAGLRWGFKSPLAADVRSWRIKRFRNYLVFYRPIERGIQVVRVLHGARDIESIFEQG